MVCDPPNENMLELVPATWPAVDVVAGEAGAAGAVGAGELAAEPEVRKPPPVGAPITTALGCWPFAEATDGVGIGGSDNDVAGSSGSDFTFAAAKSSRKSGCVEAALEVSLGLIDLGLRTSQAPQTRRGLHGIVELQVAGVYHLLAHIGAHVLHQLGNAVAALGDDVLSVLLGALEGVVALGRVDIVLLVIVDREVEWHLLSRAAGWAFAAHSDSGREVR
ncbi:hypothetical protein PG996_004908 [Apiospora saccharicola]|uniref:Uncharacterized protein n=1 Tax=Apiospora saccharicola TaxID=335842 RepID=A0ABR1VJZ8_9PEZI